MPCAAILLAAGRGSRFRAAGGVEPTKLVALVQGEPLVRRVAKAALGSRANPVIVVTGHACEAVAAALSGLDVMFVHNLHFATGLAGTLRAGIEVLPTTDGAVILLGDMPAVTAAMVDRLIEAAEIHPEVDAVVAAHGGRRGNPALLKAALFPAVTRLQGDAGARALLRQDGLRVHDIELGPAVALDVDEPSDIAALRPAPEG